MVHVCSPDTSQRQWMRLPPCPCLHAPGKCGVGFRGHSLWQDGFVEVLVTYSSSSLTILIHCFFMYRLVYLYFHASGKSKTKCISALEMPK